MKHIKTPFRVIDNITRVIVVDSELEPIFQILRKRHTPNPIAIAAELMQAINAYDALVEALQAHKAVGDHVQTCSRCGDGLLPPVWRRLECAEYDRLWNAAGRLTRVALEAAGVTD